jgi:cardiolipin synthase A/B
MFYYSLLTILYGSILLKRRINCTFANQILNLSILQRYILLIVTVIFFGSFHLDAQEKLTSDSIFAKYVEDYGIPITENNNVTLLTSGQEKFEDLIAHIKKAKHHIHLEYFNFRNDSIAAAVFEALAERAAHGVKVRALFDAFGNWSNNKPLRRRHLDQIRSLGIEIVKFDPMRFPYINHAIHRDHRKIVVIDGLIGYTGGMNIADYYIHGLPKVGNWYDMHMRIEGSAVRYLQEIFINTWNTQTKQHVGGPQYYPDPIQIPDSLQKPIAIVDRLPRKTPSAMRDIYSAAILSAQHRVRIINPYFIPTKTIKRAIRKALAKGVKVEIMVPSKADIPFTPETSAYIVNKLRKLGATIYFFDGGFHHTKIMTVDDTFCTVGSANLNSRSLRYDYETNAFIFDKGITAQLDTLFVNDTYRSTLLTPENWKQRSAMKKFMGWFGGLLTPFL